jgi:putative DNA methylase
MATKKELLATRSRQGRRRRQDGRAGNRRLQRPEPPKTCLEVDFPILPVNQVAIIEGNAGKPIYQMSKWWARRRSSVFPLDADRGGHQGAG